MVKVITQNSLFLNQLHMILTLVLLVLQHVFSTTVLTLVTLVSDLTAVTTDKIKLSAILL